MAGSVFGDSDFHDASDGVTDRPAELALDLKDVLATSEARKLGAERWVAEMRVAIARGSYLTADEMKITFGQYSQTYLSRQIWVDATRRLATNSLQRAEEYFGPARPLSSIRRGDVQAYVVSLTSQFAPGTVRTSFQHVRTMMRAAHIDGVIANDPTMGITLPKVTSELVILSPDHQRAPPA